jgi:hypothetical protein
MDVKDSNTKPAAEVEDDGAPPPPASYRVARTEPGEDTLNTIDVIGERPFSV